MRSLSYYPFNLVVLSAALYPNHQKEVRMKRTALLAIALGVTIPFILWDMWAASAGHWGFNELFVRGPYIVGIPLEDFIFSFCMIGLSIWLYNCYRDDRKETI